MGIWHMVSISVHWEGGGGHKSYVLSYHHSLPAILCVCSIWPFLSHILDDKLSKHK